MFQYHGAEHAVVNCLEKGQGLDVKNVARCRTEHPRCGTSFIFIVFIIMLVIFSFAPLLLSGLEMGFWQRRFALFSIRLLLLVPVVGLAYELLKFSGRHEGNPLLKVFIFPGLLIQRITATRPSRKQIEVAIAAYKAIQK
jgi:uncharacterized protein YqhQ